MRSWTGRTSTASTTNRSNATGRTHRVSRGAGLGLALALVAGGGLAACGSDDDGDGAAGGGTGSGGGSGSGGAPAPSDLMLTDSASPAGYSWNDVAEVLGDDEQFDELREIADATVTDPAECATLSPTAVSVLMDLREHSDTTAAVEFLPHDERDPAVVQAMVSTDPEALAVPDDLSVCESFTQENEADPGTPATTYQVSAEETEVIGAEGVQVITILGDSQAPGGDEPTSLVVGTVGDIGFRVSASGIEEPRILMDIVDRQVDQIIEVTGDPDDADESDESDE